MNNTLQSTLASLQNIPGLTGFKILTPKDRAHIQTIEEHHNHGVKACLQKEIVLIALHDETFRKPHVPEVIRANGKVIFPPVPFPELDHHNAITGSPGSTVHTYLKKKYYNNKIDNEATLLIGFNFTSYTKP